MTVGDLRKAIENVPDDVRLAAWLDGDNDVIHSVDITGFFPWMFGGEPLFAVKVEVVTEDEYAGYSDYGDGSDADNLDLDDDVLV